MPGLFFCGRPASFATGFSFLSYCMRFYRRILAISLLASAATSTQAQTAPPLPTLKATLDTVAVTGTTRVLTLASALGPDIPLRVLTPGMQVAVFHARPSLEHEYDLMAIRVFVSGQFNRSNTGQVLINLVLSDSSTHAPSELRLLPTTLVVTDREVRKAKKGLLTLDLRPYHLSIPANGIFVLAQGQPSAGDKFLGDTLIQKDNEKVGGAFYIKLGSLAHPGPIRVVNAMNFICIRDIRTTVQPQTWDYYPKKAMWRQRKAFYPKCPQCVISNAGMELVVREL